MKKTWIWPLIFVAATVSGAQEADSDTGTKGVDRSDKQACDSAKKALPDNEPVDPGLPEMRRVKDEEAGFTLQLPVDWTIKVEDADGYRVIRAHRGTGEAIVEIRFPLAATGEKRVEDLAAEILQRRTADHRDMAIEWVRCKPARVRAVADITYTGRDGLPWQGTCYCGDDRKQPVVYIMESPASRFRELQPLMLSIITGFKLGPDLKN